MFDLTKCPCCEAKLAEHMPETDDDWEYWSYECYASICLDRDGYFVDSNCERVTEIAVRRINEELRAAAVASDQRQGGGQ